MMYSYRPYILSWNLGVPNLYIHAFWISEIGISTHTHTKNVSGLALESISLSI